MPTKRQLKNPELMHVVDHADLELVKSCGVSLAQIAATLGYRTKNGLYKRLRPFRLSGDPYPLSVSALIECGLWRLGRMDHYIAAKARRDGADRINWDKLPER